MEKMGQVYGVAQKRIQGGRIMSKDHLSWRMEKAAEFTERFNKLRTEKTPIEEKKKKTKKLIEELE